MQIWNPDTTQLRKEPELIAEYLPLDGATVLELGCGTAQMTRLLAERFAVRQIVATEVDRIQHEKNLESAHPACIDFRAGGAQDIATDDASFDAVFMFKSLHHVPRELMAQSLREVARVLKPGGKLWVSEPVFSGEFNEILRLFHNEQEVRALAFQAVTDAVIEGTFELVEQLFFLSESRFSGFEEFEQRIINVSHTRHQLADETYATVKRRFMAHVGPEGACFHNPMRVDLLRKAEASPATT